MNNHELDFPLHKETIAASQGRCAAYGVVDKTTKQVLYREKLGAIIHSFNVWFQKLRADCPLPHQGGAA